MATITCQDCIWHTTVDSIGRARSQAARHERLNRGHTTTEEA